MNTGETKIDDRKLMNHVGLSRDWGECIGFWSTTYEFQPEFFETDYLPALLGLGAWDDRHWTTRIAIERRLSEMDAACVMMDARGYQGRPRSLRIDMVPAMGRGGIKLHAKVSLFVYEEALHMTVGSANLTEPGCRRNIEIAGAITATAEDTTASGTIREALENAPSALSSWWNKSAERVNQQALQWLDNLPAAQAMPYQQFVWSGGQSVPLWRQFVDKWPTQETIQAITIVSPFWSDEDGNGPVAWLIKHLSDRNLLKKDASVHLIADGQPIGGSDWLPVMPESYGSFNFGQLGIRAIAHRVDPTVTKQEVMQEGFSDFRKLHAKVVLLQGPNISQVYLGSANFTRKGWGFLRGNQAPNIEAGLIIQSRVSDPESLVALVPKTTGEAIPLNGGCTEAIAPPKAKETLPKWPMFIDEINLTQSVADSEELILEVRVNPDLIDGSWAVGLMAKEAISGDMAIIVGKSDSVGKILTAELNKDALRRLLLDQEVLVTWWDNPPGVNFPVNVSPNAKVNLPISPESGRPDENMLLAYYQGRITYEELFPPIDGRDSALGPGEHKAAESGVDTSQIQSYQIREFVESLEGIRQDLKNASASPRSMKSALRGPVSPLALARSVRDNIQSKKRTPTAGAFQLVEILNCLQDAGSWDNKTDWADDLNATLSEIGKLLDDVVASHPSELGEKTNFYKYRRQFLDV